MTKFLKVAYWSDREKTSYSDKMEIQYINIDEIYKIYQFKKESLYLYGPKVYSTPPEYKKFNFKYFFSYEEIVMNKEKIEEPTVILTKNKEIFYHPKTIDELIKTDEISINNRFDILDL